MNQQSVSRRMLLYSMVFMVGTVSMLESARADERDHEGLLAGMAPGKIAIVNRSQSAINVYPLGDRVKVTVDGNPATFRNLARGQMVILTTETRFGGEFVIAVAALTTD